MEWSLHIARAGENQAEVPEDIERVFGAVRFTRIAFAFHQMASATLCFGGI